MDESAFPPTPDGLPDLPPAADPVLAALTRAEESYLAFREAEERHLAQLRSVEAQLAEARSENTALAGSLSSSRQDLATQRSRTTQERDRAARLAALVRDIHASLYRGDVYDLILRACLTLTEATRGLYVTVEEPGPRYRVRSAVDVDGYPQAPPSPFVRALCDKVLQDGGSYVWNTADPVEALPEKPGSGEDFRTLAAVPVAILQGFSGIVIVADKPGADFAEEDIQALIHVGDQSSIAIQNSRLRRDLEGAYVATIATLADAVEAKDPYTHGHCQMVARHALRLARRLGLAESEQSIAGHAGLLHDVGKIGISDSILNKPGALLPEERELMKVHSRLGYDMLRHVAALEPVADAVLHHHEWFDGTGYPDGLHGEAISLVARIISVADAYSAMKTRRSYKEPYTEERTRNELSRCAGTQFDPEIVTVYLTLLDEMDPDELDDLENCSLLPGFLGADARGTRPRG